MNDEIIEFEENNVHVEQMLKELTLGGTEFRYNIKKHKHISSYETYNGRENS